MGTFNIRCTVEENRWWLRRGDDGDPRWRPSPGCGRAALGTVRHAPELWEIATAMLPRSTGAVGGGTRRVARVVWRVAGLTCAVARWPSAVTRAILHTLFLPPTSGVHDVHARQGAALDRTSAEALSVRAFALHLNGEREDASSPAHEP